MLDKPLAAEPLSGILYPPNWPLWQFEAPYMYKISIALHHLLTAYGMYLFLSLRGVTIFPALFGAVLYSFGGISVSMDNMANGMLANG